MSRHALGSVVLFVGAMALAFTARYADDQASSRMPASLSAKELALREVRGPILRHTDKIRGPLETSLELIGTMPEKKGDVFVLKGVVTSDADLENVDFKWAIPRGVDVVNGSASGVISFIKAGQPMELQLTLKSLEAVNHQVHLITSGGKSGIRFAASAQYNTLLQQLLNDSKENLLKSTEKEAQKASVKKQNGLKIFH